MVSSVVHAGPPDTALPYPGMLPNSPMYILKMVRDKIIGFFIFKTNDKAYYALKLADKRLSEAKALSEMGMDDLAASTAAEAAKENAKAQQYLIKQESQGNDVEDLVNKLLENSARQQAVLSRVLEKAPEQAKEVIQRAMEMSLQGLNKAQEMILKKTEKTSSPSGTLNKSKGLENKGLEKRNKP